MRWNTPRGPQRMLFGMLAVFVEAGIGGACGDLPAVPGPAVTTLRAGIIIGDGPAADEIVRLRIELLDGR